MNIKAVYLNNFKSYKGLTQIEGIDEGLSENQNIILFGGLNGAGKTSFLEAVFLCFYGKGAKGLYPSRGARYENYETFLCSCLNDEAKSSAFLQADMYVEVHLSDMKIVGNFPKDVVLYRKWSFDIINKTPHLKGEDFLILENGFPIQELPKDEYEDKISQILPYSVAQFFFFDGEKIQDFASDADNEFASSLKDVLGINLYEQLAIDLKQVRGRILTEYNKNKDVSRNLSDRYKEKEEQLGKIEENEMNIRVLIDEIDDLETTKESIEQDTFRHTRITSDSRDNYEIEKRDREVEKETLERDYLETAKDYLPFILTNNLCEELEMQIEQEEKLQKLKTAKSTLEPQIEKLTENILESEPKCSPALTPTQSKFFKWKIDNVIRAFLSKDLPDDVGDYELIHGYSPAESKKIKELLQGYNRSIVVVLQKKAERLKQIEIDLRRIERAGNRAGGDEAIKKLFDDKEKVVSEIATKKQQIRESENAIAETRRKLSETEKQITILEKKSDLNSKQREQILYCEKLQETIKDFQNKFQSKRKEELQDAIMEMWNELAQKDDHITRIEILPERNFEVKIFDHNDRERDKTKLSAGEKEIYAISLLWALVKVSGKRIPIIVDTPYGRLDSKHRESLAKSYFSKASHQVLLLSQDKEIVEEYYEILKPAIANEFSISYNAEKRTSEITKGYKFAR